MTIKETKLLNELLEHLKELLIQNKFPTEAILLLIKNRIQDFKRLRHSNEISRNKRTKK